MSAQIVHAVKRAIRLQIIADSDNTPSTFEAFWPVYTNMPHHVVSAHLIQRNRDQSVRNDAGAGVRA